MSDNQRHPIEVVSRRTGLSKDLLRAWERRYSAVEPGRSGGGRRLYSDADIERLRLLRLATRGGRRIKSVVGLSSEELAELVREDEAARQEAPAWNGPSSNDGAAHYVQAGLRAIEALDGSRLSAILERAVVNLGNLGFATGVAGPLLNEVGDRWHNGTMSPRHEHLASAALRGVLTRLAGAGAIDVEAPGLVVATPAGQHHEFGALLIAALAANQGWRVTYLGPDLPALDIVETAAATDAIAVALSLVFPADDPALPGELHELRRVLPPETTLLLGGRSAPAYAKHLEESEVRLIPDLVSLYSALDELRLAHHPVSPGRVTA